jgi:nucleoside-diphosphate-sugar epimerase
MRAVVTGSHGFIGRALNVALHKKGWKVSCFDPKVGRPISTGGDFLYNSLEEEIKQADVVFHLSCLTQEAAELYPTLNMQTNLIDTERIARLCGEYGKRLVFTSSASVYGNQKGALREDAPLQPTSNYAIAKVAAEHFVRKHCPDHFILRLSNVYGPGQTPEDNAYCGLIGKAFHTAMRGEPIAIYGSGRQTRDFTYIDDVVDALLYFGKTTPLPARTLNISSGREYSIWDIVAQLQKFFPRLTTEKQMPRSIDNIERRRLSRSLAADLAWYPQTLLEEGLQRTYNWCLEQVNLRSGATGDREQPSPEASA